MKDPRIVVVGSLNHDLVAFLRRFPAAGETVTGDDFQTFCGGKGANQAYAAGKLGASVAMAGQVGNDSAGDAQIENLRAAGVNTTCIGRDHDAPTGTAIIGVDESRQNRIIVIPGANGTFTPARLERCRAILAQADFVLLQLEIPMATVEAAAAFAREGRARVILDPAPAAALAPELIEHVDYLTPNLSELSALTGRTLTASAANDEIVETARLLCRRGAKTVIAKLGERGALIVSTEKVEQCPAFVVKAVDTTAAGDCFNAAFATALVEGKWNAEAGRFACAAAALSVTRRGAQPGMPARAEVEKLLASL